MTTTPDESPELSTSEVFRRGSHLIRRSLRAMPGAHALALTGAIVFALAAVALSRVLAWVTDNVIVPGLDGDGVSGQTVWAGIGLIMAVGVFRGGGAVVRRYFLAKARYGTELLWRRQLFEQYLRLPMAFHQSKPTGQLLAHADNDITVASIVLMPFAFTAATLVLGVVALISLALIHPLLALVALVLFPSIAAINHYYTSKVHKPAAAAQEAVGDVSSIAHESFEGVLVVKALGREDAEVQRLREAGARLRDLRVQVGRLRAFFEPAIDALPNIGIVVLLGVGAWLIDQGTVSVGDLVGAMALFSILALPMRIVGFFLEEMPRSVVALARVDQVLDVPTPPVGGGEHPLPSGPLEVRLDDVHAAYGETGVLDGVSFAVSAGEAVAVVGATGSGKSTIARILAGLQPVDSGQVTIGGIPVGDIETEERTNALAMAFQETFLFADTLLENVSLGRDISEAEARLALESANAVDFVEALPRGVNTVLGERGITLSGGQRQRIALARALAGEPRVMFLDDATSAVDPVVEAQILDNLRRNLDLTLIVVAHRLSTIELADRVIFLADGHIAGTGSHDELMRLPSYAALARAYELGEVAA
ncbi:MAG: ABC transporter ATP-binding protein [Acidimicrobiales bacterium]